MLADSGETCLLSFAPYFYAQFIEQVTYTRIKICGITSAEDARLAVDSGADAIGLVFYPPSPRAVTASMAAAIVAAVPPFVTVVALFVDEPAESIRRILESVPVDLLQFHGEEPAAFCEQFQRPWIKALRVQADMDLVAHCRQYRTARAVLLDSWQEGVPGGTGRTFDWDLAGGELPLPVVLAGGLGEHNVGEAVTRLRPAAVDVSGGVEQSPGRKDAGKIKRFIAAVRSADALVNGAADDE
ncbi:MAG: phosphoribosylanthranilate isomerase [Halieaceae bacterium]|nr:phosphoribosylanthranilate isomerase [Halieaceae bacterium]